MLYEQIYKPEKPKPVSKPEPKPELVKQPPITPCPRTEPTDKPTKLPPAKKVPREYRQELTIGEHRLFSPPNIDE